LDFVLTQELDPAVVRDSCSKPGTFAMTNDTITENDLFILGSDSRCHHSKGGSLHLRTPFEKLAADVTRRDNYLSDVKAKLAQVHKVRPAEILIVLHTSGSNVVLYAIPPSAASAKTQDLQSVFGDELIDYHYIPALSQLTVHPNSFSPAWNRDFRDPNNVVNGLERGEFQYYPPEGWIRYGLNVSGRFDHRDDTWLGDCNEPGEWAVAYHGTSYQNVGQIMTSPLHAGTSNAYGKGIYCSPIVSSASQYSREVTLCTSEGKKTYAYMFICRVNVRNVCRCKTCPCPDAQNPDYTLHITTHPNGEYWFVNENNGDYENIRTYGLLVKEVAK
jgi:hypothetical protein